MDDDESAAALDVVHERRLRLLGPLVAVVVRDDDLVFGELRLETRHVLALRRRSRDLDLEQAGLFEHLLEQRRRRLPGVVVLPIDDECLEFGIGASDGQRRQQDDQGKGEARKGRVRHDQDLRWDWRNIRHLSPALKDRAKN